MRLNIRDEFSPLKTVVVSYGEAVPPVETYNGGHDPVVFKPVQKGWNRDLLLRQQENFFDLMEKYGVRVLKARTKENLWWQMFTRDTGFTYGDTFFYALNRVFVERVGEIDCVLPLLKDIKGKVLAVGNGTAEGGDVLVAVDELYIGVSNRTSMEAVEFIRKYYPVRTFQLGNKVMHLDGCMTVLSANRVLIYPDIFQPDDLEFLKKRYKFLPITLEEAHNLGGNVLMINPETVVVEKSQKRIADMLKAEKFKVELVEYTESVALEGAFRCTTLPLERE